MAIADYELYERLKPKLGEEETRALLERFDRFERELPERVRREAATKTDLQELRASTKADFQELETSTKENFLRLEYALQECATKSELQELREEFQKLKEEFLKFKIEIIERVHGLERRIARFLYVVVLLFFIFNGDKVVGFVQALLRLTGR